VTSPAWAHVLHGNVVSLLRGSLVLLLVLCSVVPSPAQPQKKAIVGTWQLLSRIDRDPTGTVLEEPSLGSDPIGYLVYDASGNMCVQIMARHRSTSHMQVTSPADTNNLAQVGGYDAYFGRYEIDSVGRSITHRLEGAIGPSDVGRSLTRHMDLRGDTLTLWFEPGGNGTRRVRTLIWRRVSR
jgi:hypothetical protein